MLVDRQIYIKLTSAFYFVDADILRVYMIARNKQSVLKNKFSLELSIKSSDIFDPEIVKKDSVNLRVNTAGESEYAAVFIDTKLNLEKTQSKNGEFESMSMVIIDEKTKARSKKPLNVKIKSLLSYTKKKGIMHCSKCMHMTKNEFVDLKWNIKLLKKIGYDKKYLCDHMIEKDDTFAEILKENESFLELDKLKCIPNLQNDVLLANQTYVAKYTDLCLDDRCKKSVNPYYKFDLISVVIENECYMNNIDKYQYVKVSDNDETVLPKQLRNLDTLDSVRSYISNIDFEKMENQDPFGKLSCDQDIKIESYLETLAENAKSDDVTFHFKYGTYVFNSMVDNVFRNLEIALAKLNISHLLIAQANNTIPRIRVKFEKAWLNINNRIELQYALSLLNLYKSYVKPFLNELKNDLKEKAGDFDKLFFITGNERDAYAGKSIHNTRRTMDMFIHWSVSSIEISNNYEVSIQYKKGADGGGELQSSPNIAHMSHFRENTLRFDQMDSDMSILSFHFDVNYLKCFMIPLLI
jgi:hypothetical protein